MQQAKPHIYNLGPTVREPNSKSPIPSQPCEGSKQLRRLLNFQQLRAIGINWSREHLWRLEAKNKFPRRIYLSPQKVAWFEDEVLQWVEQRADERRNRVYRCHD